MTLSKRVFAEFFGTFWLVFGGCGAALFAAAFPGLGIGFTGVAFAFGLTCSLWSSLWGTSLAGISTLPSASGWWSANASLFPT